MENADGVNDWTFKANFTVDGELNLRERVKEKLKELIGDSTDDILVDYVIMLLRNGRRKEEARSQLNHILGDDSGSFVCWLWDHLNLNMDLYLQPKDLHDDQSPKRLISEVQARGDDNQHLNSESERGTSHKLRRSRRNKGWEELASREAEPPTLRSSEVFVNMVEKSRTTPRSSSSSSSPANRRMNRGHLGKRKTKSGAVSQETIDPPRRLLQFAIREALPLPTTSRPSFSGPPSVQPSLKRLRYLVFKSHGRSK